jgi:hypothetical protein
LPPSRAACSSSASAASQAAGPVAADPRQPRDLRLAHRGLSTSRMSIASSLASRYRLTPTITSSPRSTAACRRAADSSIRSFGIPLATALVMPPMASTSSISAQAASARSAVSFST